MLIDVLAKVRKVGTDKGCRIGNHGASAHERGCLDGRKARVPVFVVCTREEERLRVIDSIEREALK